MTEFYKQFFYEDNVEYSIVIDDDGEVAYAYLYKNSDIVGDVWLYNQASTPLIAIWEEKNLPFLNPQEFIKDVIPPIRNEDEIAITWTHLSNNEFEHVLIYIRNKLIAKISVGSTPGWSTCVAKSGPLALMF